MLNNETQVGWNHFPSTVYALIEKKLEISRGIYGPSFFYEELKQRRSISDNIM
jgi:hypothetical protein